MYVGGYLSSQSQQNITDLTKNDQAQSEFIWTWTVLLVRCRRHNLTKPLFKLIPSTQSTVVNRMNVKFRLSKI